MLPSLRTEFNRTFTPAAYGQLLAGIERRCGSPVQYRVAETPIFVTAALLEQMAQAGAELVFSLMADAACMAEALRAIPAGYLTAAQTAHPHFLTADFALVREPGGRLAPRLVEIQAFPSIFALQSELAAAYREAYTLPAGLGVYLSGLDEQSYWKLLARTILGGHDPENVVLTEVDPEHQKTLPDFVLTARRLGLAVVDISTLTPIGDTLHYRNASGQLVPIRRIYNRAIADELISRHIELPFRLDHPWQVEWAGHPNWYFLISKFSIPWLCRRPSEHPVVPPAVFLDQFLAGPGRARLAEAGVPLPAPGPDAVYSELLLKPLFSFAGKGIAFAPAHRDLEAIPPTARAGYLLQQRMDFVPTIETPMGPTQAEIRLLYLWPDSGALTPVLSLVRLGRGKMMGVDHNRNLQWVGASAAFFPSSQV